MKANFLRATIFCCAWKNDERYVLSFLLRLTATSAGAINLAVCKTCIIGCKLHVNGSKLYRLSRSAQGCVTSKLLQFFLCSSATNLERSPDRSGSHAVYADALRSELLCK